MPDLQHKCTPQTIRERSEAFEASSPREILKWAVDCFGSDLVMATGFGSSGIVLAHQLSRLKPDAVFFYLETDLLYPETHQLKDALQERLGISFTAVHSGLSLDEQAAMHGPELWSRAPDKCCALRKVAPLRNFLAGKRAWITGIRRDQSKFRSGIGIVEWDLANGLLKLNPLANWTRDDVWQYINLYNLPYNRLHDEGYPSIGCMPCTRAVAPGEDKRAGRWSGFAKTECGIHLSSRVA